MKKVKVKHTNTQIKREMYLEICCWYFKVYYTIY